MPQETIKKIFNIDYCIEFPMVITDKMIDSILGQTPREDKVFERMYM